MEVGSLVECIKGFPVSKAEGYNVPEQGHIYTVREVDKYTDGYGILLEEVVNEKSLLLDKGRAVYDEMSWHSKNFREIQPPMTINIENLIYETTLQP